MLMSLWVLGWTALFLSGLIQYNVWVAPLWGYAVFCLIVSPFTLIWSLPLALAGYWIGRIRIWENYRFHWAMALPVAAAIAIQIPGAMDRLNPERDFKSLMGVDLPSSISITNYESCFEGIDNSIHFELSIPASELDSFYAEMAKENPEAPAVTPTTDRITHDLQGAMIEVTVDRVASTMTVSYLSY
ncbi:hypothetical protein JIN81_14080 [Haloferula rosea]|uniref:Uncharacterized protein n=2 Tax=Haloferula rosea TaxID=490093 RepID=A0A934RBR2_9BACT|nr:hypothetical protein [Haloferula rosea]